MSFEISSTVPPSLPFADYCRVCFLPWRQRFRAVPLFLLSRLLIFLRSAGPVGRGAFSGPESSITHPRRACTLCMHQTERLRLGERSTARGHLDWPGDCSRIGPPRSERTGCAIQVKGKLAAASRTSPFPHRCSLQTSAMLPTKVSGVYKHVTSGT